MSRPVEVAFDRPLPGIGHYCAVSWQDPEFLAALRKVCHLQPHEEIEGLSIEPGHLRVRITFPTNPSLNKEL